MANDVLVSYDSLPKIGGAHMWMYEVYRRWGTPVEFVTALPDKNAEWATSEAEFDARTHGALRIHRVVETRDVDLFDPRSWLACLKQSRQIGQIAGKDPVRLHALRAFPEGVAALMHRLLNPRVARLITYAHGEEILVARSSRQLKMIAQKVYAHSDLVIANSENTRRLVLELCPTAKLVCIHPGVNVAEFEVPADESARYRGSLGWAVDTVIVATVARMEPRKNHAMVMRAIARLRAAGVPVAYVCGGDGEERQKLGELARSLGIVPWVRFVGRVSAEEKRLILASCDVYAMPSTQVGTMIEGFGIVFIEAAAARKPSVAGRSGGQAEAVLHGKTGLLVDGESLDEVSDALNTLAANPASRLLMGEQGAAWALDNDWTRVVKRTWAAAAALGG